MFEVKVSAVTAFADRTVGTGTDPATAPVTPTLCVDIGQQDTDISMDVGPGILDAIAEFAEAALLGAFDVAASVSADGDPAGAAFPENAPVDELLRVRRTALLNPPNGS